MKRAFSLRKLDLFYSVHQSSKRRDSFNNFLHTAFYWVRKKKKRKWNSRLNLAREVSRESFVLKTLIPNFIFSFFFGKLKNKIDSLKEIAGKNLYSKTWDFQLIIQWKSDSKRREQTLFNPTMDFSAALWLLIVVFFFIYLS